MNIYSPETFAPDHCRISGDDTYALMVNVMGTLKIKRSRLLVAEERILVRVKHAPAELDRHGLGPVRVVASVHSWLAEPDVAVMWHEGHSKEASPVVARARPG